MCCSGRSCKLYTDRLGARRCDAAGHLGYNIYMDRQARQPGGEKGIDNTGF